MTLRFGLACVGFLGACSFVFVGCGDDDVTDGGGSGKGGEAGAGARGGSAGAGEGGEGAAGQGGTSGTGARGGNAGMGGSGGSAGGSGRGGTAGTGGSDSTGGLAGDAGGGPVGGEGGFGGEGGAGTGPGGAGNAGEAGAGGVPDTTADQCKYECVDDDDCARGIDTSYKCHPTRKRCENPGLACDSHDDCLPVASGWVVACANDGDCTPTFEECVDVGGRGLCASIPYLGVCFTGAEMQMPRFGSTNVDTTVCGSDAGRCDDKGQCFTGCTDALVGCPALGGHGPNCNTTTGLCECTMDTQCTAMGVSRCNMTTHLCECETSADCTAAGTNECVSGRCGCASVAVCSATLFPGATPLCE